MTLFLAYFNRLGLGAGWATWNSPSVGETYERNHVFKVIVRSVIYYHRILLQRYFVIILAYKLDEVN